MGRYFNTTGACNPQRHYMVNIEERLKEIKKLVDAGEYFTINRARQYGKTTTLKALAEYLKTKGENYKFRFLINPLFILGDVYSEADLILLCPAGIIVYEIKNYQDTVIASNSKYWEHHIGNQTFKFYSPYQQNETHIRILKEYIRTKTCNVSFGNRLNYIVHNIVVFASETERRSHMTNIKFDKSCSDNIKNAIFNLQNIKKTVKLFGDGALSDKEIDELYKQLFHTTVYIPEQREKQIEYAKQQGYDD